MAIKAVPATLMFDGAKRDATLTVQTPGSLKFRILNATADLDGIVVDPSEANSQPGRIHLVKLRATKGSAQTRIGRLRIETDHPAQPVVHVAIMQQP